MIEIEVKNKNIEDWKRFRRHIGREIKAVRKEQKKHWILERKYHLQVLTSAYEVLGWDYEKFKLMSPEQWAETKGYLQCIHNRCDFLLMIQPGEKEED